ncbi:MULTISPECIES: hypothetical protein [Saccharothrix]|uniref:hypothetical protein n=1 Tax=Saccharothrix TaxID=2071 RepID=UPI001160E4CA|nr:hypothetical protein [Saccharothrix sp. CB00851]
MLTLSRKAFADLLIQAYPAPDDAGPFGPVVLGFGSVALNPQPLPPKDLAWRGAVAAGGTIRYALDRYESAADSGRGQELGHDAIARFVRGFCGTPPTAHWPWPWPPPPWWPRRMTDLTATDVLVAGARFDRAVRTIPDGAFTGDFDSAASSLFDAGLRMLDQA